MTRDAVFGLLMGERSLGNGAKRRSDGERGEMYLTRIMGGGGLLLEVYGLGPSFARTL